MVAEAPLPPLPDDDVLEEHLHRRSAILEAVRLAAERFLDPATPWTDHLPEVLASLALATGTSRVYVFEHHRWDDDGEVWTRQIFEWSAPGVRSIATVPELLDLPLRAAGFGRWVDVLSQGEPIVGLRREMQPEERRQMTADETLSIALVPILVEDRWWGMLGFDECVTERVWSPAEVDGLRAAASTIAAAIRADRADAALRAREREYRAVFEATGDGLVVTDRAGHLVAANPAFCRMHGASLDDLLGRDDRAWVHPDWRAARAAHVATVTAGGSFTTTARDVRSDDGTSFPVEVSGSRITFRGEPHVLGVVRDVTDRERSRTLLEQRVRALSQVAASLTVDEPLGDTLAGIARVVVAGTDAVACAVHAEASGADVHVGASEAAVTVEVPMHTVGRTDGTLVVGYAAAPPEDPTETAFLRALADQAAVAVENDRLLRAAQDRAALEERQRLARELHDSVSQALFGIGLGARTPRAVAETDRDALTAALDYVLQLAEAALAEMRALIFELRPEALEDEGVVAALERQVRALEARHDLEVAATLGPEPTIPLAHKQVVHRVAQEALRNVARHAGATRVTVTLDRRDDHLTLAVTDDGRGFDAAVAAPGRVLATSRGQAEALGGTVTVDSAPGAGTRVRLTLPIGEAERAD